MTPRNGTLVARLRWAILPQMGYAYSERRIDKIHAAPFLWLDSLLGRMRGSDLFQPIPEIVCTCDYCLGLTDEWTP